MTPSLTPRSVAAMRGFSLIELMVGTTVALWLLLGAMQMIGHHLASYRAQVRELRLNQELRTAADLMTRDLKRAGHWSQALQAYVAGAGSSESENPYTPVLLEDRTPSSSVEYAYDRSTLTLPSAFGFRRRVSSDGTGSLQMKNAAGGWQPLTDPTVVNITRLAITPVLRTLPLWTSCPCRFRPVRATACDDTALQALAQTPRVWIRQFDIEITGTAPGSHGLERVVREHVRLGNGATSHLDGCPAP